MNMGKGRAVGLAPPDGRALFKGYEEYETGLVKGMEVGYEKGISKGMEKKNIRKQQHRAGPHFVHSRVFWTGP